MIHVPRKQGLRDCKLTPSASALRSATELQQLLPARPALSCSVPTARRAGKVQSPSASRATRRSNCDGEVHDDCKDRKMP